MPRPISSVQSRRAVEAHPLELDAAFRRYASYVAAIGVRILGRDDEVDDLVQDVFVSAHRSIRGLRDPDAIKSWLARITVRAARRRLRLRRARRFLHFDEEADYALLAPHDASPEQRAQVAWIYRKLDSLPAQQRIAWTLRHVQGESLERIAELCECSLSTVQRALRGAESVLLEEVHHG